MITPTIMPISWPKVRLGDEDPDPTTAGGDPGDDDGSALGVGAIVLSDVKAAEVGAPVLSDVRLAESTELVL